VLVRSGDVVAVAVRTVFLRYLLGIWNRCDGEWAGARGRVTLQRITLILQVTVAKSFDAPIKLLFPRDVFAAEFKFSMLGLGDIVIPGLARLRRCVYVLDSAHT
jgi:hypothetical protein